MSETVGKITKQRLLEAIRAEFKTEWNSNVWLFQCYDSEGENVPGVSTKQGVYLYYSHASRNVRLAVSTARLQSMKQPPSLTRSPVCFLIDYRLKWIVNPHLDLVVAEFCRFYSSTLDYISRLEKINK